MDDSQLQIAELVGRGAFADVHLGTYHGLQVAVKICRMPVNVRYSEHRDKCMREFFLLKSLDHENVLRYIDIIENKNTMIMSLILEYIDGGSMERFCHKGRYRSRLITKQAKLRIATLCWNGLAYLHDRKICHKDIKPENIMISNNLGIVKICDFGLSELKEMVSIYSTNSFEGTCMYLPPELASEGQQKKFRRHPQKSDVYSMGATLCEFFSGRPYWSNDDKPKGNFEVLFILKVQWDTLESGTEAVQPSCWKALTVDIQNLLTDTIAVDFKMRKSAKEMFNIFIKVSNEGRSPEMNEAKHSTLDDQYKELNALREDIKRRDNEKPTVRQLTNMLRIKSAINQTINQYHS